jgi:DNA-binding helix-hairpin-helix protein with protein kinase domain
MNNYDNKQVIQLLDSSTISALFRLYGIQYDSIAFRLRQTRQAIVYKQKHDRWKDYEREIVFQLLQENGLEISYLVLINTMVHLQKNKLTKDVK